MLLLPIKLKIRKLGLEVGAKTGSTPIVGGELIGRTLSRQGPQAQSSALIRGEGTISPKSSSNK